MVEKAAMRQEGDRTAVDHEGEVVGSWTCSSWGDVRHWGDEVAACFEDLSTMPCREEVTKRGPRYMHESFPGAQSTHTEESRCQHVVGVVVSHAEVPGKCENRGSVVSHKDDGAPDSNRDYFGHVMVGFEGSVARKDRC